MLLALALYSPVLALDFCTPDWKQALAVQPYWNLGLVGPPEWNAATDLNPERFEGRIGTRRRCRVRIQSMLDDRIGSTDRLDWNPNQD